MGAPSPAVPPAAAPVRRGWRTARRGTQLASLALFFALLIVARTPVLGVRPDLFLALDPLAVALTVGAAQVAVAGLGYALATVALTLVFGRAFCGWICPLGTLLDAAAHVLPGRGDPVGPELHARLQSLKYYVLAALAAGALLSAQWAYLLDPMALLTRGLTSGVYPAMVSTLPERWLPVALRTHAVGFALAPVMLLVVVVGLTAVTPRFYCRYLCPLGALLGALSRVALLRRRVSGCDACRSQGGAKACIPACRMGAVPANQHYTQGHECIRCMTGRETCHVAAIRFAWRAPRAERVDVGPELDRRRFLVTGAAGAIMAPIVSSSLYPRVDANALVRPPRVLDEQTFVDQCIRCGLCVQACPTQTLQLTSLEAGAAALWTPAVTPTVAGCKADCNACSAVCPTDAIPPFGAGEADKWLVKMGTAVLEKGRCIGFTEAQKCGQCIDVCPTKAFVVEAARPGVPRRPLSIDYSRCIGCGLCETKCRAIVFGAPALTTSGRGRGEPSSLATAPTRSYVAETLPPPTPAPAAPSPHPPAASRRPPGHGRAGSARP